MELSDSSNHVVSIEDAKEQPLMTLLKHLINYINYDRKQNMVLTNSQIIDLLGEEFNINMSNLHDLEIDIYLSIMKKFLKQWPQWDDFDCKGKKLKSKDDNREINKLLEENYLMLKKYLNAMLEIAKPMAKEALNSISMKEKRSEMIMEVHSSRAQLNNLFFKKPIPTLNDTILNISDVASSKITLEMLTLVAILNWWHVDIQFNVKNLIYTRKTTHVLNHLLINKKVGEPNINNKMLDMNIFQNIQKGTSNTQMLKPVLSYLVYKIKQFTIQPMKDIVKTALDIFLKDIDEIPCKIDIPSVYRRKLSKYPYIRYLNAKLDCTPQTEETEDKYDLRLQETIVPEYELTIKKADAVSKYQQNMSRLTQIVLVECKLCMVRFSGDDVFVNLINHFTSLHMNEPNWTCTNCNGEFTMVNLCENWWYHKCENK